jgi:hypothetical protein
MTDERVEMGPYCEIHDTAHHVYLHALEREVVAAREVVEAQEAARRLAVELLMDDEVEKALQALEYARDKYHALSHYDEVTR